MKKNLFLTLWANLKIRNNICKYYYYIIYNLIDITNIYAKLHLASILVVY